MNGASENLYTRLVRPFLFRFDAETTHRFTLAVLRSPLRRLLADSFNPPELKTTVWDITFRNPIGLAAGADKDARAPYAWETLGFGFAELGTITPRAQAGNPAPRMWRLQAERALINRLGFPGDGMEAVAPRVERVRARGLQLPLGLNFGPNKDTPAEKVAADYAALTARLGATADFVVVNLSSPNTPGLREWQAPERIRVIVDAVRAAPLTQPRRPPLLIKISPDLHPLMLREVCAAALDLGLDGIVATNTTIARDEAGVRTPYEGGLSGAPLAACARRVIGAAYEHTHGRIPIVGVGGIASAGDAYDHIRAGASLVELYTGFVYRGPRLVHTIKEGLMRLLTRDGFRSISEAVGTATRP
ncbi:MAG: quinone-dependent dihydroorotate dehydrogenase [Candidatus Binataceae bacterium]